MIVEPLTGKAKQAISQTARIVALEGSVRSGKTWASLTDWLLQCLTGPEGDFLMAGRTQGTVIENLVLPLQRWCGSGLVRLRRDPALCTVTIAGRRCRIVGAHDSTAEMVIQGPTYASAYIDEASTVPESFFDMADSRLSVQGARMWLTSNPEGPSHWLKVNWLDRARLWIDGDGQEHDNPEGIDLTRVSFRLEDNPNLPAEYVANLKAAHSGLWYRRYILGEWCIAAGAVYEEWDPERHVTKELPKIQLVLAVSIDYGTTNPTVGLLLGISAEEPARLVVLAEWSPERATDANLSRQFRAWLASLPPEWQRPEWVIVDPSAASFRAQLYEDGFGNVYAGDNAVLEGIRTVASLLSLDRLLVSERCEGLTEEIPGYVWDPKATARGEDAPVKENDHYCDALRYGVLTTQAIWGTLVPLSAPGGNS